MTLRVGPSPTAAPHRRGHPCDRLGLALTTTEAAARLFAGGVDRLLALQAGGLAEIEGSVAEDPHFALGHAVAACVLAERDEPQATVWAHLNAARSGAGRASEREASFVTAALLWCNRRLRAQDAMVRHVRRWPLDVFAVSLLTPSIASSGVDDGVVDVWDLLDGLVGEYPTGYWWLASMRAFARTEQLRFAEAEQLAAVALAERPASGHAAHALAHVHYETGRRAESVAWIDRWLAGPGAGQEFRSHFAWHAALCELRLGDQPAAARRFERELAGLEGPRALVDGGALCARGRLLGLPVGDVEDADRLAAAAGPVVCGPGSPFVAWNAALLAWVRKDGDSLDRIEAAAAGRPGRGWAQVATASLALRYLLDGHPAQATSRLGRLGDTAAMGGSPAQREILDDLLTYCLASI